MKKLFIISAAAIALASCSNDDVFTGETNVGEETGAPITFSSASKGFSRGYFMGEEAADMLGKMFVVEGWKGPKTAFDTDNSSIVYENYLVNYQENTAQTTESNSSNWEYVGIAPIKHATDKGILKQTIKFWDYTQPQYDFIAWSTGTATPIYEGTPDASAKQVLVSKIKADGLDGGAYSFTGTAENLAKCYISDLVTVKKEDGGYQQPVKFAFRSLGTKVRIAIYETVPGYSVKDVKFYSAAASNDAAAGAKLFTTTANEIFTAGTYTVKFPTVDATTNPDNNLAHVVFTPAAGDQKTTIDWGNLKYTLAEAGEKSADEVYLGRTSNTASFAGDEADNYYTVYIPNETGTNLNLRVNYTLESIDGSGETINVKGATAVVPSIYTQWKPGYAYTYIFKISDKTNGHTGVYDPTKPDDTTVNSDPAGLYPITFDAVVEDAEEDEAIQHTITTVSAPSITTYAQKSDVVNNNEYTTADGTIYVTVDEGATDPGLATNALVTLTNKAALYIIPTGKTEAEVIDALQIQDEDLAEVDGDGKITSITGRNGVKLEVADFELTNKVEYGADGNPITVGTDQAAKFTPTAGKTYAFVYIKTAPDASTNKVMYQKKSFTTGASVKGYYHYAFKAAGSGDCEKGILYFTKNASNVYEKHDAFIGQGVSNLYVKNGDSYVAAKGYAVTGQNYFYTLNHGVTYIQAHNVAWSETATTGLYTTSDGGVTYDAVTAPSAPAEGVAYYYKNASDEYIYCVFTPEQEDALYVIDEAEANIVKCPDDETAKADYIYLDKYVKNFGVYYSKVIKIQ